MFPLSGLIFHFLFHFFVLAYMCSCEVHCFHSILASSLLYIHESYLMRSRDRRDCGIEWIDMIGLAWCQRRPIGGAPDKSPTYWSATFLGNFWAVKGKERQ